MSNKLGHYDLLVLDFEFTVYQRAYGRPRAFFQEIIEIGSIYLPAPNYSLEDTYQAFVKPRFYPRLTQECKLITLIKQEDIDQGVSLENAIEQLKKYCKQGTKLVAWGNSDRDVLKNVCHRYGLEYPFVWEDYIDLSECYKNFYHIEKRPSLKNAVEEQEIDAVGISHSALDDAINTAKIIGKMIDEGWNPA